MSLDHGALYVAQEKPEGQAVSTLDQAKLTQRRWSSRTDGQSHKKETRSQSSVKDWLRRQAAEPGPGRGGRAWASGQVRTEDTCCNRMDSLNSAAQTNSKPQ